jgi:hypothetical protein
MAHRAASRFQRAATNRAITASYDSRKMPVRHGFFPAQGRYVLLATVNAIAFLPMRVTLLFILILFPLFSVAEDQENNLKEIATKPCDKAEHRQFDFWVGEWDVLSQNEKIAESSIQQIIGDCVIYENYSQADRYMGKSFNFYDSHLRKWRQTWVDANGMVSEFAGEFKEGALRYEGESHFPDGRKAKRKMTFFNLGPDRVRQLSEISRDDGKTWTAHYDLLYVRKN